MAKKTKASKDREAKFNAMKVEQLKGIRYYELINRIAYYRHQIEDWRASSNKIIRNMVGMNVEELIILNAELDRRLMALNKDGKLIR
jgi:hypothetical protein